MRLSSRITEIAGNASAAADDVEALRKNRKSRGSMALGLASALIAALLLSACSAQTAEVRDNSALRLQVHAAVPTAWRQAAESIDDISPLATTPEIRDFAHSVVKGRSGREEQIIALTHEIISDDGLGLRYEADATRTASEAFRSGTANCMGFANLLIASAREVGLNAEYELVSQWPDWNKVGNVLVSSLHIRVVSRVAGNRLIFDLYPDPIESAFSAVSLSDNDALAHHLNNLAMHALRRGDNAEAYAFLYKSIETSPDTAFVWSNMGILLSRHDLNKLAEAAFQEALLIEPDGLIALSNLQRLYNAQGRYEEAQQLDGQLVRHRSRNPYYHAWQGQRAYEQGNFEEAIGHFKDAISRKKNERNFYVQLSKSYEQLGMDRLARKASGKAQAME